MYTELCTLLCVYMYMYITVYIYVHVHVQYVFRMKEMFAFRDSLISLKLCPSLFLYLSLFLPPSLSPSLPLPLSLFPSLPLSLSLSLILIQYVIWLNTVVVCLCIVLGLLSHHSYDPHDPFNGGQTVQMYQ